MKIIIIGSKGFIGKHCFDYFTKIGHHVYGCDIVPDNNQVNYHVIDACNSDFSTIFRKHSFDVCINCSGAASVPQSFVDPQSDYLLNVINVFKLLEAIKENNRHCKFINLSSAAVYGNPQNLPISETHRLRPLSPYGEHKMEAENLCKKYFEQEGVKTCSVRIFSAYGKRLQKQLFWDVYQKSKNGSIELFGTGSESRDFVFIDDITSALDIIIQYADFRSEVYNIASGTEISIYSAVTLFLDLLKYKGDIRFIGQIREGDPLNWQADISKIVNLGYRPSVSLKNGLEIYVEWLKELN